MQDADPLIHTKLRFPFVRPDQVPRPRLQELIAQGLRGPLTLVIAPAGYGKTTLVSSATANLQFPTAWVSLDQDDNRAGRFLQYVIAGLRDLDPSIGVELAGLMAAPEQAPRDVVLTSLINDLEAVGRDIALVLDDYQFIASQTVHEAVTFLVEHGPSTFHLLIASRSDPVLPLARWRGRGHTVELRAADLRFTQAEAAQFLRDVMGLQLDAASVAALAERTEGWIVGLQMAALSMRDRKDVPSFIEGFSGTNRNILDYLLEEVLAGQPPAIQRFILYTSVLERLTAPLCDAVLGNDEGSKSEDDERSTAAESLSPQPSASILDYVERANLFLVPLDDKRIWYRYHHLFADLLRAKLQESLGAQGVAQLHLRASDWHAKNGSVLEAIYHASMASDDRRVERLIDQNYMEILNRGEMSWLRSWTGKLSKELVHSRPRLCIYEAMSHAWFGELDEAEQWLEEADRHLRAGVLAPEARPMLGHLAYIRSRVTAMRGDLDRAIELCLVAREHIQADDLAMQLDTRITLGYEYFLKGDFGHADPILHETIRLGSAAGSVLNTLAASCILARAYAVQGLLRRSYDLYEAAAQFIPEASGQHLGAQALVAVGIADVQCEWNDLESALVHASNGLALMPWWGKADDFALAYITLARIHLARANKSGAAEAIEKASQLGRVRGIFSEARKAVEVARVKLWLAQGDLQAADRWASSDRNRAGPNDRFRFENELADMTRARVLTAHRRPKEAISLLSQLEDSARSGGRQGRLIEIMLLKALALQAVGDTAQADVCLRRSLSLAEPEGYVRLFLDEGQPAQMLLAQWLAHSGNDPLREYAARLVSLFNAEAPGVAAAKEEPSQPDGLVERLSQRELEVLHLLAIGSTNQEIAHHLIVAAGTVKAHTASIYRKLDVANRTEAVARARQLGILP